jgi:opacity protein-like surface antigen
VPVKGKLRPFLVAGAGYMWLKERDSRVTTNNNQVYSFAGPSFAGGAGGSYFITNAVSFDLGLQYSYSNLKDKLNPSQVQQAKQFAATMGVSVYL